MKNNLIKNKFEHVGRDKDISLSILLVEYLFKESIKRRIYNIFTNNLGGIY